MRNKNIIMYITILFMIFLTGCGLWGDKTGARTIKNPSEMPEIVFVYHICHLSTANSRDDAKCSRHFMTKMETIMYQKIQNYVVCQQRNLSKNTQKEI